MKNKCTPTDCNGTCRVCPYAKSEQEDIRGGMAVIGYLVACWLVAAMLVVSLIWSASF